MFNQQRSPRNDCDSSRMSRPNVHARHAVAMKRKRDACISKLNETCRPKFKTFTPKSSTLKWSQLS